MICGDISHGHCDRNCSCINCGGNHKSNNKRCSIYEYNKNIQEISAIRNVSYYEAKKIIDDKQDSYENPWVKPSKWPEINQKGSYDKDKEQYHNKVEIIPRHNTGNYRMDNRTRIERRGTMMQQKETNNHTTYPIQTTSKSIQQRLNNSERTKSNSEENKSPQTSLVLNNIIKQWEDIKTEEWSEDELAKYFNEIAAYAMRRTMAIKKSQCMRRKDGIDDEKDL